MIRVASVPPASNRGYSETERVGTLVDWVAASVDLIAVLDTRGAVQDRNDLLNDLDGAVGFCALEVATHVNAHFFGDTFKLGEQRKGTFYAWRFRLENEQGEHVGLLELGGEHTRRKDGTVTARIELTGQGCRLFEATSDSGDHATRWSSLASLLGACSGRLTRVDIAADDLAGQYPVDWAIDRYEAGDFDRRGQRPKARHIDDMGNKTGRTFYVGRRGSERQLRIYEKGRELGDPDSEWVRYECEFHASCRYVLPLDILTNGSAYLVGAYPVLDFIEAIGQTLRVATEKVIATCKRAVKQFRRIYGPMLNAMLHAADGDEQSIARLVSGAARNKLPGWCKSLCDTKQLLNVILFAPVGASMAELAET